MPTPNCLLVEPDRAKLDTDNLRERALKRLYMRKAVVDDLIRSLEKYQRSPEHHRAQCITFPGPPRTC